MTPNRTTAPEMVVNNEQDYAEELVEVVPTAKSTILSAGRGQTHIDMAMNQKVTSKIVSIALSR